jgi:sarcosine oxidase, subunit alpha
MQSALDAATRTRLPEAPSQIINRAHVVKFTFDGREYSGYEGDTIASALLAAGVNVFSRSFKYHRPRGILCATGNCPNCLVQRGDEPNVHACTTPITEGMTVESQNAWPTLETDVMSLTQRFGRFLPPGFYYKAFMHPRALWPLYERVLRSAAGLGKVDPKAEPDYFDKIYKHADVTVIGGGLAGLSAAQAAAKLGSRVLVIEEQTALGGHLRRSNDDSSGQPAHAYASMLVARLNEFPNVEVMTDTCAFGRYEDNWLGAVNQDRLVKVRTKALVVATGSYQIPALFENNDLPGVMLASGVQQLIRLWGVCPGSNAAIVSANRDGLQAALDLLAAGVRVQLVAEMRESPDGDLVEKLKAAKVEVLTCTTVASAHGKGRLEGVTFMPLKGGGTHEVSCDLLVLATAYMPANGLLYQAGGKFRWDETLNEFIPDALPDDVFAAGEVTGTHTFADIEREGELAGIQAALAAGYGTASDRARAAELAATVQQRQAERTPQTLYHLPEQEGKRDFVCVCEDVTRKDIRYSVEEGYDSVELLKRYSTVSMGPCQGKMCNMHALHLCAHYNHQTIAQTGTTTSRPPVKPVSMGALGGRLMEPVRYTPMHDWHVARGAQMMNAGLWKRPHNYGDPESEVRAVRERVGLIDVSTLGKIHLHGKDVPALLDRFYTNRWQNLKVGQVRYGVMTNDEGVVIDDGVTARLDDNLFYMTTTSEGATSIYEVIEWWLQSGWTFDVHVLNATDLRAAMNLAGPASRDLLRKVATGVDLSNEAFPYMHVREATIAGAPVLLMRIGFTGELSYEIHAPSGHALHVWEALMDAGQEFGIEPFGVEAQRVLRLEKAHLIVSQDTDGLTNPYEANMAWAVKLEKDNFLGKPALVAVNHDGATKLLVGFEMPDGTLPEEGNQIIQHGTGPIGLEIIGRVTSVRRSPTLGKVIGLCWLPAKMATPGQSFTVRTRGELKTGRVVPTPFYDPDGTKLRG